MNKTDIIIWYRLYLPTGGGTDVQFKPLSYRSFDDFKDEFNEKAEEVSFVDYEVVDWDYLSEGDANSMNMDEDVWNKWNELFEVSKRYGIPANVIVDADHVALRPAQRRNAWRNSLVKRRARRSVTECAAIVRRAAGSRSLPKAS